MSTPTAVVVGVGAERGLGAALCRRFASEGYHVLVGGRTPEKIAQVARTIGKTGGSAEPVAADTTREEDVVRLFDRAMSPGDGRDPADLVVFNAGNNQRIDFRQLTSAQFEDSGALAVSAASSSAARRRAGWLHSAAAPSSSPARPPACAASRDLRILRPPRPDCG
jgi:NAD(P)-dependent dehydrogenase (short-subunit alcohol dehydrogenase family)